jgi:tetratricopeptide (TPR) repeat protein
LAYYIQGSLHFKEEKEKEEYMEGQQRMFQEIISAYYPDKFKYQFKGIFGLNYILNWFYQSQQFDKVLFYFNDFLKRKGDSLDFDQDIPVFAVAVPNFISIGKFDEAERWIARICDFSKQNENLSSDQRFIHFYSEIFNEVIKNYEKKGQIASAEKSAGILTEEMLRLRQWMQAVLSIISQAKILEKMGKKEEAKKMLIALYKNDSLFKNLNELSVPYTLNLIAWTMVELKIVDPTSLEIAEKAIALNPGAASKDTLACVHAALGNFKEAVKIESEALAEEKDESSRQEYANRIRAWQAKIK